MTKSVTEHAMFSSVQQRTNHKDFQNCLFACFLLQAEPKKVIQALKDPSWIEAIQEELLQFKLQQVWTLVDLPYGKRAIGTKWVYRNKKDERGIVIGNKARLMDVKSAFLYGKIKEEVYVCQPPGFEDPDFPDRVYKVEKALYGLYQAPRAWYETLSTYLLENRFQRGQIDKTLFIKRDQYDILIVQTKIHIDNESTICIVKNPVFHSKTKHIEIRHHFIRDSNEKKLIQMIKIHTDQNVTDLLTKAFDMRPSMKEETKCEMASHYATSLDEKIKWGGKKGKKKRQDSVTSIGPNPRQCLMFLFIRELVQVVDPGAKKPWGTDLLKLELMEICTKLSKRVLDLETTKSAQAKKIANLKKRVKKLERKRNSRTPEMNLFKIDRDFDANIDEAIEQVYDANKDTVEEGEVQVPTADMEVNTASAPITTAGVSVSTTEPITIASEVVTTAEPNTPPTTTTTVIEDEDLIIAQTLMKMKSEKSKLSVEEKSRLFVELMDKRKKHFARLKAEEQRRKPQTKAQKRNQMYTYLKNMDGFTYNQLVKGNKDKTEGSKKRTRKELDEESVKRQKIEDDVEKVELKLCLEIVPYDDKAVNFEPLAIKSLINAKWKVINNHSVKWHMSIPDLSRSQYKKWKEVFGYILLVKAKAFKSRNLKIQKKEHTSLGEGLNGNKRLHSADEDYCCSYGFYSWLRLKKYSD
ncbi:putative ribonuclease H-like domain-containing protein [Tanacetum coccineum]|uniref:Ribonuclease H-like domain-containing protein n=1 Tax=Tanacetum coccineum TaxID=301880 RepID=A0ABQ4YJ64_9ASTR